MPNNKNNPKAKRIPTVEETNAALEKEFAGIDYPDSEVRRIDVDCCVRKDRRESDKEILRLSFPFNYWLLLVIIGYK